MVIGCCSRLYGCVHHTCICLCVWHRNVPSQWPASGPRENGDAIGTLPILPHQTHWFFDCGNLRSLHGSPEDVVEMTVPLLSRCTSPAGQARQAPWINCFVACTCMALTYSASKSVCHYYAPAPRVGALSDDARLTSVCRVHRA